MGVGRFAFTPILPLMQDDFALGVREGGWLASANYVGYLIGALSAVSVRLTQRAAIRGGLAVIGVSTLATAFIPSFAAWIVLRFLPGVASAWVLVFTSAWALDQLERAGRPKLGGVVYAGVGAGIVFAGLACLFVTQVHGSSRMAWIVLGAASLLATAALWPVLGTQSDKSVAGTTGQIRTKPSDIPEFWRLVLCYGAFGLGYIIPATFLPAMAKGIIPNPLWFGWVWPVFGAAAVISTLLAAQLTRAMGIRRLWSLANLVMAIGVLVPLFLDGLGGIVIAALCVGATFMVSTMAGMQEARRIGGAHARRLMAAMTAAFAAGQIIGPLIVGSFVGVEGGFAAALISSAVPLCLAAWALYADRDPQSPARPTRPE